MLFAGTSLHSMEAVQSITFLKAWISGQTDGYGVIDQWARVKYQ